MPIDVLHSISAIPAADWDALLDPTATPFVRHAFLDALESSGSAAPDRGWTPRHLVLREAGRVVAAAPAYVKIGQDGSDFARDWVLVELARRMRIRFYPKLVIGVPITPVTGRRILCPGDRRAAVRALLEGARELCERERLSGVQVLFPDAGEADELAAAGMVRRIDYQAHWFNRGYADPSAWLASLDAKRRHQARREKGAAARQGITIRTVRGAEIAADPEMWGREVSRFYRATLDKMGWWGQERLNQDFFVRVFRGMPDCVEVVEATREGRRIAAAWNVSTATHLYGRYWGCVEEHPFLHFSVCLYHSIDDCILRGLEVFEGGAGGQHKIFKGFDIAATYSMHTYLDPRLDAAVRQVIEMEARREP